MSAEGHKFEPVVSQPSTMQYRGAEMLIMQVPIADELKELAAAGGLFGEPRRGSFRLDTSDSVLVTLAHFPDAPLGWSGEYGTSERVNLPHSWASVKVPLLRGEQRLCQTAYALSDDDAAINIYRMGYGLPSKLANFSLPAGATPANSEHLAVARRGHSMLEVSAVADLGEASTSDVAHLFERPEFAYGTGSSASGQPWVLYNKHVTEVEVLSARRVDVGSLLIGNSTTEGLGMLAPSGKPLAAWRVTADLTVTSSLVKLPRPAGKTPMEMTSATSSMWRFGGEQVTLKKHHPQRLLTYQNGDIVWAHVKLVADALAPYLPPGMSVGGDEAVLWNVRWNPTDISNDWNIMGGINGHTTILEYNELWVNVPVVVRGKKYMYPIVMLLDDDVAQIGGRDGIGCPKKLANMTFTFTPKPQKGATMILDISRRGRRVMKMRGTLGKDTHKPVFGVNSNFAPGSSNIFVNTQQFIWNSSFYLPSWITINTVTRTTAQTGLTDVELEFGTDAPEPLGQWFKGPPVRAGYIRMDQDWLPAFSELMGQSLSATGLREWWAQSFALLYM